MSKALAAIVAISILCFLLKPKTVETVKSEATIVGNEIQQQVKLPEQSKSHEIKNTRIKKTVKEAENSLPTQAQVANSPSGIHDTPREILLSAKEIGKVEAEMMQDKAAIPDGVAFFNRCARTENTPLSLRSVCLKKAWAWSPKANISLSTYDDLPDQVKDLARFLPE